MTLNDRFASLGADRVGDLSKLQAVANTVAEFLPVGKGNAIDYKMVVDVIGIEMRGDDHLIFRAPHLSRGCWGTSTFYIQAIPSALLPDTFVKKICYYR